MCAVYVLLSHTCNACNDSVCTCVFLCVSIVASVLKYIAYAADMPVCLPQAIERKILTAIETKATPGKPGEVYACTRVNVCMHVHVQEVYGKVYLYVCVCVCVLCVLCTVDSVAFDSSCDGTRTLPQSWGQTECPSPCGRCPLWQVPPVGCPLLLNVLVLFKCY